MRRILSQARFLVIYSLGALAIFYGIMALLVCLFSISADGVRISGFGISMFIFLFISGLNCFTVPFRFAQANSVTRLQFFIANSFSLWVMSAGMAVTDVIATVALQRGLPYQGIFEQLYPHHGRSTELLWTIVFFAFAAHLGWLISMVYYRSAAWLKTVVSISPVVLIISLAYLNGLSHGRIAVAMVTWLGRAFGLSGVQNPLAAVLTLFIGALLSTAGIFLLVRRASVRAA